MYRYIQVYSIYCHVRIHTKVTTTFHFESGLIRLATPMSFQSTLEPFIMMKGPGCTMYSYTVIYVLYLNIPDIPLRSKYSTV